MCHTFVMKKCVNITCTTLLALMIIIPEQNIVTRVSLDKTQYVYIQCLRTKSPNRNATVITCTITGSRNILLTLQVCQFVIILLIATEVTVFSSRIATVFVREKLESNKIRGQNYQNHICFSARHVSFFPCLALILVVLLNIHMGEGENFGPYGKSHYYAEFCCCVFCWDLIGIYNNMRNQK